MGLAARSSQGFVQLEQGLAQSEQGVFPYGVGRREAAEGLTAVTAKGAVRRVFQGAHDRVFQCR